MPRNTAYQKLAKTTADGGNSVRSLAWVSARFMAICFATLVLVGCPGPQPSPEDVELAETPGATATPSETPTPGPTQTQKPPDPDPRQPRPAIIGEVLTKGAGVDCSLTPTDSESMAVVLRLNADGGACEGSDGEVVLQVAPNANSFAFPAATAHPDVPVAPQPPEYCIEVQRPSGSPTPAPHGAVVPGLTPTAPDVDIGIICVE